MKKILLSPWTAIITLVLIIAIRLIDPTFVESVRLRYFDTLITHKEPTQNPIYTVNIDEAALDKYGQWPFDRRVYAQIISDIYKRNAGLVVFNVLMPEADRSGGDAALSEVLKTNPVILGDVPATSSKNEPHVVGSAVVNSNYLDRIVTYPGIIANIPQLESSAAGVGIINTLPEIDGVNRRMPVVAAINGKLYDGVSLEVLRVLSGDSTFQVKLSELGVEKLRIPKFGAITTDNLGRVWIDYSQRSQSVSLSGMPDNFDGAIVVVGVSAAGIANPVPTPIGAVNPHELQSAVIATLANGVNISRPDYADGIEIIALLLAGIALIALTRWVIVGIGATVFISVFGIAASFYVFEQYLWLYDATAFTVGIVLVALHAYTLKFVSEFLQKQRIKKQFGSYLSPAMVEKLQKNPELLRLGGETRELSIMFSDVRGFTTISEHYGDDVQGLTKIMNRYMTAMTQPILDNGGTLDKYIGDAQMAFWNAPLDDADHAYRSVSTAMQMLERLDEFNKEIAAEGIPAFGMGIGINTAPVVVGNMGSVYRFDYTCLGDGVNLASRLEGQSKNYGVRIILGPTTANLVFKRIPIVQLDSIAVKGKHDAVNVFTVINGRDWGPAISHHRHFLMLYQSQDWDGARFAMKTLRKSFDGQLTEYYDMMSKRIDELEKQELPSRWDGVYRATSK
jgi:adenylate cyclase